VAHQLLGTILDPAGLVNFASILQNVGNRNDVYIAAGNYLSAIVHANGIDRPISCYLAPDGFHEQQ